MLHPLDIGKRRLCALVNEAEEAKPRLPLVHSTDTYLFSEVLDSGVVEPQPCSVFTGEALTYLFYGRPSFRPNAAEEPSSLAHYFPVCLIFRPDWMPAIKRVLPFDSGAFRNGLYEAHLHRKMRLGDFLLENDPSTPGRVASLFFGSAPSYLLGRATANPEFDPAEFEAQSYKAMINSKAGNAVDSRGSGVELQTDVPIDIGAAVEAVVLPSQFVESRTGERLESLGIACIPYRLYDRSRPSEYTTGIHDLCMGYYIRRNLINERDL